MITSNKIIGGIKMTKKQIEKPEEVYADFSDSTPIYSPTDMTETKTPGIFLDGVGCLWGVEHHALNGTAYLQKLVIRDISG